MSLVIVEGMEDQLTFTPQAGSPTIVTGRTGNCILHNGSARSVLTLPSVGVAPTEYLTMGAACYINRANYDPSQYILLSFLASGLDEGQLWINPGGVIQACRYNMSPLGTSAAGALPLNRWFYLEIQYRFAVSVGVFNVWIDGVQVVSAVNVTTKYNYPYIDQIRLEYYAGQTLWDDFYLMTGYALQTPQGISQVDTLLVNGNGAANQWIGSDGNSTDNYALVDERPPSMTDYVQSSTPGHQDLYTLNDLSVTLGAVRAVTVSFSGFKDDVGARSVKPLLRRTTTVAGTAIPLDGGTGTAKQLVFPCDPETAYGAEQNPTIGGAPATTSQPTGGTRWQFNRAGRITKLRYQRRAGDPSPLTLKVWSAAMTKLAEIADAQSTGGYFTVTLSTPITVAAGDIFTLSYTGSAVPATASGYTVTNTADCLFVGYYYTTTAGDVFPSINVTTTSWFVEPIFEAQGPWTQANVNALQVGLEVV